MTIFANETLETIDDTMTCVLPMACNQRASIAAAWDRNEQFTHTMMFIARGETYFTAVTDLSLIDGCDIDKDLGGSNATGCVVATVTADSGIRPMQFGIAIRRKGRFEINYGYYLITPRGQDGVFMSNDDRMPCYRLVGGRLAEVKRPALAQFN